MVVTPAISSPAMTAHWIGAAPRQRGSSEACTFRQPKRGMASTSAGSSMPYAATHTTSGSSAASAACSSASRNVRGQRTGMPRRSASAFTGLATNCLPRPRTASGRVYTATTSCWLASSAKMDAENSGVPMKTTRIAYPSTEVSPGRAPAAKATSYSCRALRRAVGSQRSNMVTPSRWSVSCCRQRPKSPSPSISHSCPSRS